MISKHSKAMKSSRGEVNHSCTFLIYDIKMDRERSNFIEFCDQANGEVNHSCAFLIYKIKMDRERSNFIEFCDQEPLKQEGRLTIAGSLFIPTDAGLLQV